MGVDIRVKVRGGGHVSQIYGELVFHEWVKVISFIRFPAIRQAISKSLIAYYQKCKHDNVFRDLFKS